MYNFAGWFAAPPGPVHERGDALWPGASIVDVHDPFEGVGLRAADPHACIEDDEQRYVHEFGDPLLRISQEFPELTFVYIEAECFGGQCLYAGEVFQRGKVIAEVRAEHTVHRLVRFLGAVLDDEGYFAPFDRAFQWGTPD